MTLLQPKPSFTARKSRAGGPEEAKIIQTELFIARTTHLLPPMKKDNTGSPLPLAFITFRQFPLRKL